jgi:DNA-binding NarL/FixJ family response regulator
MGRPEAPTRLHAAAVVNGATGPVQASPPYLSLTSTITAEELRILALLADGLALNSVAAHVAVSPRTVRRRLRAVCDRLGLAHPIQAIVWAARRGLI